MKKSKIHLEVEKEDKTFALVCEPNSSLGSIFDVLSEMQNYIMGLMQDAQPKKEEEEVSSEKKDCEESECQEES